MVCLGQHVLGGNSPASLASVGVIGNGVSRSLFLMAEVFASQAKRE